MGDFLQKFESILIRITIVQFCFLLAAQALLTKKELSPYVSRTIFLEGVFFEYVVKAVETLDQFATIWYDI